MASLDKLTIGAFTEEFCNSHVPFSEQLSPPAIQAAGTNSSRFGSENLFSNQRIFNPSCAMGKLYSNSTNGHLNASKAGFLR
jgi:hypothetical protein